MSELLWACAPPLGFASSFALPAPVAWVAIGLCLSQSAMFSGLNLALFGLNRLQLEIEAESGDVAAQKILALRQDTNFLLTTVLWGNVTVNVALTLITESVLTGLGSFVFSTFGITLVGEIAPQAWFSRNAMRMGAVLAPLLRVWQVLLWPVARPSALALDAWLGKEGIPWFRESHLRAVIQKHMDSQEADLAVREGVGALNFLQLDDLPIASEGELVDPRSVVRLPVHVDLPIFPEFEMSAADPLVAKIAESGRKWVILTDEEDTPRLVIDADEFLRGVFLEGQRFRPYSTCHRPIVINDPLTPIGRILRKLKVKAEHGEDDVIDDDLILLWSKERRIITGADLLGRLLRGVVTREDKSAPD